MTDSVGVNVLRGPSLSEGISCRKGRTFLLGLVLTLFTWTEAAVSGLRYETCVENVNNSPNEMLAQARSWRLDGGGMPASHCVALALKTLGRYREAARELESLAKALPLKGEDVADLHVELLGQAGDAWLLAEDYEEAVAAYNRAIERNPEDAATLTRRGSAWRLWGAASDARQDINRALELAPDYGDALLVSGYLYLEAGDFPRARSEWEKILRLYRTGVDVEKLVAFAAHEALDKLTSVETAVEGMAE